VPLASAPQSAGISDCRQTAVQKSGRPCAADSCTAVYRGISDCRPCTAGFCSAVCWHLKLQALRRWLLLLSLLASQTAGLHPGISVYRHLSLQADCGAEVRQALRRWLLHLILLASQTAGLHPGISVYRHLSLQASQSAGRLRCRSQAGLALLASAPQSTEASQTAGLPAPLTWSARCG